MTSRSRKRNHDERPLVAYLCASDEAEDSRIAFAKTNDAIRFSYAAEIDVPLRHVSVRRAPQHDAHSPGPVPLSALLADGWRHECASCYRMLSFDEEFVDDLAPKDLAASSEAQAPFRAALARFDAENPQPDKPSPTASRAERWAVERTAEEWRRRRHDLSCMILPPPLTRTGLRFDDEAGRVFCDVHCERRHHDGIADVDFAHQRAEKAAEARWPGCPEYASGRWPQLNASVGFLPPGLKNAVRWSPETDDVFVAQDDAAAWHAFLRTIEGGRDGEAEAA